MDNIEVEVTECGNSIVTLTCSTVTISGGCLPVGDYVLRPELTAASGGLQSQIDGITIGTVVTGGLYPNYNPSNYVHSGNLYETGLKLLSLSGDLLSTGQNLNNKITLLSGQIVFSSQTGGFYPLYNPSDYSNSGNLYSTGLIIENKLSSLSGDFLNHKTNDLTGIYVSGGQSIVGRVLFTGLGGLQISQSGQTIVFSGGAGGSTTNTGTLTGEFIRRSESGNILDSTVVRTTGFQSISFKNFGLGLTTTNITGNLIYASGNIPKIDIQAGALLMNGLPSMYWEDRVALDGNNLVSYSWDYRQLFGTGEYSDVTLDWYKKTISGDWLTNTTPTQSGHIINKGYLDRLSLVSSISGMTGNVGITGAGTVTTYINSSNVIVISGAASASSDIASNLGNGSGIFYQKSAGDFQFKSISVENGLYLTGDNNRLNIKITGDYVLNSQTGNFYPSYNPNNYLVSGSTGTLTGNFVTRAESGQFYSITNPNNYINSGSTGSLTGAFVSRSESGQFYSITNPNNYVGSGVTGNLIGRWETGRFYGIENVNNYLSSGNTGRFYDIGNVNQYVSSGATGLLTGEFVRRAESGRFYAIENVNNYTNSGNLTATGINILNRITNLVTGISVSGGAAMTGLFNFNPGTNITFTQIGLTGITIAATASASTGSLTGNFYPLNSNPSGYLIGSTGTGILDGQLLIGASGINGFEQGNLYGQSGVVIISGSGSLGVSVDYTIAKTNQLTSLSGDFTSHRNNDLTGISISGSAAMVGLVTFTGLGGLQVTRSGQIVVFSGGAGGGGTTTVTGGVTSLNTLTGVLNITGLGSVVVTTGEGTIYVSGGINTTNIVHTHTVANISGLHSIWIPAASMTLSNVAAPTTGTILTQNSGLTYDVLDFSQTSIKSAYFNLAFPVVWDKTNVIPSFYWTTTGNTGDVNWYLAAADIKDGTPLNIQYNSGVLINDSTISGNYLHQTTGANLTISGSLADNDNCYFKVYRHSGSLISDARLIGVNLSYYETGFNGLPTGVTGISITGGDYMRGGISFTGLGSVTVTQAGQTVNISGSASAASVTLPSNLVTGNGLENYIPKFSVNGTGLNNSLIVESGGYLTNFLSGSLYTLKNFNMISSGITGLVMSGTNTTINNTLNIGAFSFQTNVGQVTAFELPIVTGAVSGQEQSYAFNIGGKQLLKIYAEYDGYSGIQNTRIILGTGQNDRVNINAGAAGAAPNIHALTVPVTQNIYGGTATLPGTPSGWWTVLVSGVTARIPYYF